MHIYDLLPKIKELKISDKVTKPQLIAFWNMLVVNYELTYSKYNYENIELMTKYNASGSTECLHVFLRYVGLLRLNLLAIEQLKRLPEKFVDVEQFQLVPSLEIWETALNEFNLSKIEYGIAKNTVTVLKNRELPKVVVNQQFKNVVQLIVELLIKINEYDENENSLKIISSFDHHSQANMSLKEVAATQYAVSLDEEAPVQPSYKMQNDITRPVQSYSVVKNDLNNPNIKSQFLQKIRVLQKSSTETVVHANAFGSFQKYMHITRPIEQETIEKLEYIKTCNTPQLMFICGSVGDGKSHLLAYLKQNRDDLLKGFYIHNDATESYSRTKSAEETLEQILKPFDDGESPTEHIIVAINIGKLHNFYTRQAELGRFKGLRQYIDSLKIFEKDAISATESNLNCFHAVDFSKVKYYYIEQSGASSPFYLDVLNKITAPHKENEIYNAWKLDIDNGIRTIVHENYEMLMNKQVQKRVVDILIQTIIVHKMIVSTRSIYNFIFDIIVPSSVLIDPNRTGFAIENTLPNLLFENIDRSELLLSMSELDPLNSKHMLEDEIITNVFIHADIFKYAKQLFGHEEKFMYEKIVKSAISKGDYKEVAKYIIRAKTLMEDEPADTNYGKFIQYLYSYYTGDYEAIEELFDIIEQVLYKWKGSPRDYYVYVSKETQKDYRIAVPLELEPRVDETVFKTVDKNVIEAPEYFLAIGFNQFLFELDLRLFKFLIKVKNGYRPNLTEINQAIQFEEFYNKLIREAEEIGHKFLLVHLESNKHFEVTKPKSKFTNNKYEVRKV